MHAGRQPKVTQKDGGIVAVAQFRGPLRDFAPAVVAETPQDADARRLNQE